MKDKFLFTENRNLHYTLLLLIPNMTSPTQIIIRVFTLHFATINTNIKKSISGMVKNLHYTLLLLILYKSYTEIQESDIYITLCYY